MCIRDDDDDDNSKTLLAPLYHKGVTFNVIPSLMPSGSEGVNFLSYNVVMNILSGCKSQID